MNSDKKLKKLWRKMKKNEHINECKDKSCEICKEIRHVVNQDAPFHATLVIFNPTGDLVLLGKRNSDGVWTSAGGHAYPGESPKQAALREAFEETGMTFHPESLIELPSLTTYAGKPAHCFMAFSPTHQEPIVTNDPDRELKEWKWFGLEENLPDPMDDNRERTVINAKMKLKGLIKSRQDQLSLESLHKAIVMSERTPGVDLNTAEYSMDAMAARDNPAMALIDNCFGSMKFGELPRDCFLPDSESTLYLSLVDDGIYSGWVKDKAKDVILRLEKITLPSVVQALEAKALVKRPAPIPAPEAELKESLPEDHTPLVEKPTFPDSSNVLVNSEDAGEVLGESEEEEAESEEPIDPQHTLNSLLSALSTHQANEIHIHIHKSLKDLEDTLTR